MSENNRSVDEILWDSDKDDKGEEQMGWFKKDIKEDMKNWDRCSKCNEAVGPWKLKEFNGKCEDCWYEDNFKEEE